MTNVHSKPITSNAANHFSKKYDAILPLVPQPKSKTDKTNTRTFEVYTDPSDTNSIRTKRTVRVLQGDEDLRTVIEWYKETGELIHGLGLTSGPAMANITLQLVNGVAKSYYLRNLNEARTVK